MNLGDLINSMTKQMVLTVTVEFAANATERLDKRQKPHDTKQDTCSQVKDTNERCK